MEEFIKILDPMYKLDSYKIKDNLVVLHISSTEEELVCPFCGAKSKNVHSYYEREIQDLPIMDKQVVLLVKTRKMFCNNKFCSKKTFSERHAFVNPKSKKTIRLEKNIIYTSSQVSSVNASKLLKASKISISKSSICVLLKKNASNCG